MFGLLALTEERIAFRPLFEGAKELCLALGLPAPASEAALRERLDRCQAQGLVHVQSWGGASCPSAHRDRVLLHAWRQGWSQALGQVARAQLGIYEYPGGLSVNGFRIALLTDSFKELMDLAERYDAPKVSPYAMLEDLAEAVPQPLDEAWLHHLPPGPGLLVAQALLNRALLRWTGLAPLTRWLQGQPGLERARHLVLIEALLYQGRFQEADQELRRLHPEEPLPHLDGLKLYFEGRCPEAVTAFDRAAEPLKGTKTRPRLLPGPAGWFHALALLATGQADRVERMAKLYGGRRFQDGHSQVWDALLDLSRLAQGHHAPPCQEWPLEDGLTACLLHSHAAYWRDAASFREARLGPFFAGLAASADRGGLPWFQAQTAILQARWASPQGREPRGLADVLEATPTWQRTLESLARLGQEVPAAPAARNAKPARLAWVLNVYRSPGYEDWRLEAREQKQGKDGGWSLGRAIPLHKVRSASVAMGFLTPIDQRAIAATPDRAYLKKEDLWRILHALAGHDALFVELKGQPEPLRIRQGEPELKVNSAPEGLRLELHPTFTGATHQVVEEAPDRLTVYAFSLRHQEVAALLGAQGLQVPPEGREQVAKTAASLASRIAIHSELPLGILDADLAPVPADATPELDLRPFGEGLRIHLRVRPIPGGPAFAPGVGAEELILEVEGRRCRALRDLALERSRALAVVDGCAALGDGWDWDFEEPVDCLELMLQLETIRDQVRLAWPEGERFKTPQRAGPGGLHLTLRGEGQWFAVTGQLQLDEGRVLELQRLLDLLPTARGQFVPLGEGQWLSLERHFRERLEGLGALAVPHGGALRLAPSAALAVEEFASDLGSFTAPKAWQARAARIRAALAARFTVPSTLQATLRPYQEDGFHWLARLAQAGLGACLADDMGLGKTLQALALLLHRAPEGPALVVAPTSVVGNWAVEAQRFAPTLKVVAFGEGDRAELLASAGPFTVVLCSYGLLAQDPGRLADTPWTTVILDEAQAIKNAGTQRSKAVMALKADARLVLSGTPVENHLSELWNLFHFLNPGLLGSAEHFTRAFALPIERDQNRASLHRLKRVLKPFLLRRTRQEVLEELPSLTEIIHEVTLSSDERAFYELLRRRALVNLEGSGTAGGPGQIQILAELMRLRRACCSPNLVEPGLALPSSKLAAFQDILGELLENRHKALVFSQFVDHLSVLRAYLDSTPIRYQYLDGATPAPERRKRIEAFQAGQGDLFLISLKAGGTGLNLTAADYVIHMDPWWNPAVEDQASARAHRMGQERPVTVYRLVAKDTIEARILALHRRKRQLADGILDNTGGAALSAEDLMDLLN